MVSEIERLKNLCAQLKAPKLKVTEKRALLSKILPILQSKTVLNCIDRHSTLSSERNSEESMAAVSETSASAEIIESKGGGSGRSGDDFVTWKTLYNFFLCLLNQDLQNVHKAVEKSAKTVPLFNETCFQCFKIILVNGLTFSYGGENNFCIDRTFEIFLKFLQDDYLLKNHFLDTSHILIDGFLKKEEICCQLTRDNFSELICIFLNLIKSNATNTGNGKLIENCANVLNLVLKFATDYCRLQCPDIVDCLLHVFDCLSKNCCKSIIVRLVECSNTLLEKYYVDDYQCFVRFGERISHKIISYVADWMSELPIIRLFAYQMVLHRSGNLLLRSDENSLASQDWKTIVKELYSCAYRALLSEKNGFKYKNVLFDLFSRILFEALNFGEDISVESFSQLNVSFLRRHGIHDDCDTGDEGGSGSSRKKRCIEVSWTSIAQFIDSNVNNVCVISWLYLIEAFISNFSVTIDIVDGVLILKCVINCFRQTKRPEILKQSARTAKSLIEAFGRVKKVQAFFDCVTSLYDSCVRLIHVKAAQNQTLELLATLIGLSDDIIVDSSSILVDFSKRIQNDLCLIFGYNVLSPTDPALAYLHAFLTKCEFSDNFINSLLDQENDARHVNYKFRRFLIDWLFMNRDTFAFYSSNGTSSIGGGSNFFKGFSGSGQCLSPHRFCRIVYHLCRKRPYENENSHNRSESEELKALLKIERYFSGLLSTSSKYFKPVAMDDQKILCDSTVLNEMVEIVIQRFMKVCDEFIQNHEQLNDESTASVLSITFYFEVYFNVLITQPELRDQLKRTLKSVWKTAFKKQQQSAEFLCCLTKKLIDLIKMLNDFVDFKKIPKLIDHSFMSDDLINFLAAQLHDVPSLSVDGASCRKFFYIDGTSDDFDTVDTSQHVAKSNHNLIDYEAKLNALQFLALFCDIQRKIYDIFDDNIDVDIENLVLRVIESYYDEDDCNFRVDKKFCIESVYLVATLFCERECSVNFVKRLLLVIKNLLDRVYKYQPYCVQILKSCQYLPLNQYFKSNDQIKEQFLRIIAGFWRIKDSVSYTYEPKLYLIRILLRIIENDRACQFEYTENDEIKTVKLSDYLFYFLLDASSIELKEICASIVSLAVSRSRLSAFLDNIWKNIEEDKDSKAKIIILIEALIALLRHCPQYHIICIWELLRISRLSPSYTRIILETVKRTLSDQELQEIFNTNLIYIFKIWQEKSTTPLDRSFFELWRAMQNYDNFLRNNVFSLVLISMNSPSINFLDELRAVTGFSEDVIIRHSQPFIIADYLVNFIGENPEETTTICSDTTIKNFAKKYDDLFSLQDLRRIFKTNFAAILFQTLKRVVFDIDCIIDGEMSERTWLSLISSIVNEISFSSLSEAFSNLPMETLLEVIVSLRLKVRSENYALLEFKRFSLFIENADFRILAFCQPCITREVLLCVKTLLEFKDNERIVNKSSLYIVHQLIQKLYDEAPNHMAQCVNVIWLKLSNLRTKENAEIVNDILTLLVNCVTKTGGTLSRLPLLSQFENISALQISHRSKEWTTLEDHIDFVVNEIDATVGDIANLADLLETSDISNILAISKVISLNLLHRCSIWIREKSKISVAMRIIDFLAKLGDDYRIIAIPKISTISDFTLMLALDAELQSLNSEAVITAIKCIKDLVINGFGVNWSEINEKSLFFSKPLYALSKHLQICTETSLFTMTNTGKVSSQNYMSLYPAWNHDLGFDDWIKRFISYFIKKYPQKSTAIFSTLSAVIENSAAFCERIFPVFFEKFLSHDPIESRIIIGQTFNSLLRALLSSDAIISEADLSKLISLICSTIQLLHEKNRGFLKFNLFHVDHSLLADACLRCGYFYDAVLYITVFAEQFKTKELNEQLYINFGAKNLLHATKHKQIMQILQQSFIRLQDLDVVYALDEDFLSDTATRIFIWQSNQEWNKAAFIDSRSNLNRSDIAFLKRGSFALGLEESLLNFDDEAALNDYRSYSAWQLGRWELLDGSKKKPKLYNKYLYDVLSDSCQSFDDYHFHIGLNFIASRSADDSNNENLFDLAESVSLFCEIEAISSQKNGSTVDLINTWIAEDNNFVDQNHRVTTGQVAQRHQMTTGRKISSNLLAVRWSYLHRWLITSFGEKCATEGDIDLEALKYFVHVTESRMHSYSRENMPAVSLKLAQKCQDLFARLNNSTQRNKLPDFLKISIDLKEIETLWRNNETNVALSKLRNLRQILDQEVENSEGNNMDALMLKAKCLTMLGTLENVHGSQESAHNYFMEASNTLESLSEQPSVLKVLAGTYASIAQYADTNFQRLTDYIKSPAFESKKSLIATFKRQIRPDNRKSHHAQIADRKSSLNQKEVDELITEQQNLLFSAIFYYVRCLSLSDDYDLKMFRLISLWFENFQTTDYTIDKEYSDIVREIPTHKWLLVWNQLTSRLDDSVPALTDVLKQVIYKATLDHPYHTFYSLWALGNSVSQKQDTNDKLKKTRCLNAKKIIKSLSTNDDRGKNPPPFADLEEMAKCYVEIGNLDAASLTTRRFTSKVGLVKFDRHIPVITYHLKVDRSCKYENFVHVLGFDKEFAIASGKSAPVVVYCQCSDGIKRKQIIKGKDDTRQDSTMEQVFGIFNILLGKKAADQCKGRMRTYIVVPLTANCGVIEWCENSVAFGDYLIGGDYKSGCHRRIYPEDWTGLQCRNFLAEVSTKSLKVRYDAYLEVCKRFQPVFRHFFFENFVDSVLWYEAVQNYSRSVAISSMVGHVVGLSDRHAQNILLDVTTGEVIHIDLGMAFEQGRILPTPEQVPFRLTRDLVDGMGVCGTEGSYRRTCERVMRLLRDSHEILLPIVSVLLHDPVAHWSLSAGKIDRVQPGLVSAENKSTAENNTNIHAELAILRIKDKLLGLEKTAILSVEGQVSYLIKQCMDPNNLALMYHGWQAYL